MTPAAKVPPPPPPPPPPTSAKPSKASKKESSPEVKEAMRNYVLPTATSLERFRCLEAEKEACLCMAASLLENMPGSGDEKIDVTDMPGGIQDTWIALSQGSQSMDTDQPVPENPMESFAKSKKTEVAMGQGQLGKAAHSAALSGCLTRATELSAKIATEQKDLSASLKTTLSTVRSKGDVNDLLSVFHEKLGEVRTFYAQHPEVKNATKRRKLGNPAVDGYDLSSFVSQRIQKLKEGKVFQAEEVLGKYMDLHEIYEENVVPIKHIFVDNDSEANNNNKSTVFLYRDFLSKLSKGLDTIPETQKLKERKKYVRLLTALHKYLEEFVTRSSPILKLDDVIGPSIQAFEAEWKETGGSPGWAPNKAEALLIGGSDGDDSAEKSGIDLSKFASAAELEKGTDPAMLKVELSRLGLKCGGTPADRAKRLFMTKDTPLDKLPKKLFAKKSGVPNGKKSASSNGASQEQQQHQQQPSTTVTKAERRVDIARIECIVMALLNQLGPIVDATARRVERQEAQTANEKEKEVFEDLHGSTVEAAKKSEDGDDSDDEDAPIYNPKGVPLGWDGKPMPYWLFKLHGLNHFYTCEICGNESYRGRRNFELHFAETKHSSGMKALGIPNTKHFHGVTKIEDAQKLWESLQGKLDHEQFDGSKEEEYEDSHGNVMSRSTYEDLARQGLL